MLFDSLTGVVNFSCYLAAPAGYFTEAAFTMLAVVVVVVVAAATAGAQASSPLEMDLEQNPL
jgi:hypothetical protein